MGRTLAMPSRAPSAAASIPSAPRGIATSLITSPAGGPMAATIHPPGTAPTIRSALVKAPTGIRGFDELTVGGLPHGRATLVTGGPGSCKTLFGLEFLVRGAQEFDEPGVLLAFEESAEDLAENVAGLGFDLARLEADGRLVVDAFR